MRVQEHVPEPSGSQLHAWGLWGQGGQSLQTRRAGLSCPLGSGCSVCPWGRICVNQGQGKGSGKALHSWVTLSGSFSGILSQCISCCPCPLGCWNKATLSV